MTDLERRLRDIRSNQDAKRLEIHPATDTKELRAVMHLAYELFGDRGAVTYGYGGVYRGGPIAIAVYKHGRRRPGVAGGPPELEEKFRGATIAELMQQVAAWRAHR